MSKSLRYAAVPLVMIDPYLNIWSASDSLYDDVTRHWTDRRGAMSGFVKVDGKWFRFLGTVKTERCRCVKEPKVLPQKDCHVTATQSVYDFENELLKLRVTFTSPLLMDDLLLMSRPVSYINYELEYLDGYEHDTQVYFDISSDICVENANTELEFIQTDSFVSCGRNTNVLERTGDDVFIDWGYLYLLAPDAMHRIYDEWQRVGMFVWNQKCTGIQEKRKVADGHPVLSALRDFGATKKAEGYLCIAYDDLYSIEYFGEKLKGFWTSNGDDFSTILKKAVEEYGAIKEKCDAFDLAFRNKTSLVSVKYADLACLAYRQVIAGHKLVHKEGKPLFFSKECGSNGCIATVDITYPSIPLFLVYGSGLIKAMLEPVFEYVRGAHGWRFEFAPHDVGQYPKANGQVYGMDSSDPDYILSHQMPIEECGNMLLCTAAVCKSENNFDYARDHFAILKQWADYLVRIGWNPENQLCTDDFAGHLAHNCNLAIKSILGIAAFGHICERLGIDGDSYFHCARDYAKRWEAAALEDDHYKLAFDKSDSWSMKYNLMWDRYFGWHIFDEKVATMEVEFYKDRMNTYGIPLDSRETYTKSDWQMWAASISDDKQLREAIVEAVWKMVDETMDRVPFTDWYDTKDAGLAGCFRNRTVQGGLFAPLLFL